ncbi:hypothetical protein [Lacisediminimonas sp.]|uniref:hypothetical protein n=1 Tax=Lacisediminimonas sp. TaxID=3060582 RepID=UPI002719A560|nr:hypothetical protein [Lacisediminimonas sp.]MDO8299754.1 hypothetical protein [Lacisediminimonas sp.]
MQVTGKRAREDEFFNESKRQRRDQAESMQVSVPNMVERNRGIEHRAAIPLPTLGPWGLFIPWLARAPVAPNIVVRDPVLWQASAADKEENLNGHHRAEWPAADDEARSSASGFLGDEEYSLFPFDEKNPGFRVDENGESLPEEAGLMFYGYQSSSERSPLPSPEFENSAGYGETNEASFDEQDRDLPMDENSQSTNEESDSMVDERPSSERSPSVHSPSVGYSETTEESSTDDEDDLWPAVRADILEDLAQARRKNQEAWDAGAAEREKREPRSFEGNGFRASVSMGVSSYPSIFLGCEGELGDEYLQPLVEAVQEKLSLSSKLWISVDEEGGGTASEVLRRIPQSQLAGISWLQFPLCQDPAYLLHPDFLQPGSLGKLLPAIRTLKVTSWVLGTLLGSCSESMAKLSKLKLVLQHGYAPSIAEWLAQHSHLKNLTIKHWYAIPEGQGVEHAIEPMLRALETNESLQGLCLDLNLNLHSQAIISLIGKNSGIRQLALPDYLMNEEGAAIIEAFHSRPRLDKLKIGLFGSGVWTALARLIASPSCPREIEVTDLDPYRQFDDELIISALAENRNLEMLNLSLYHFSRQAVPGFVDMVVSHPTLKGILFGHVLFSRDDKERIERALNRNRHRDKTLGDASVALQRLAGDIPPEIANMIVDEFLLLPQRYIRSSLQTLDNLASLVDDNGADDESQNSSASE